MVFSMLGGVGQVAFGQSFNDISAHWAKDDIEEWSGKGLISGYEDGTFRPDDKITRAEFVKLINNVISIKMEESISFVDVEERDWYFRDLRKAIYGEYIAGYEDNTFRANELITRQEAAVILKNLVQLEEIEGDVLGKFVDTNNTPDWSKAALILAVQKGYLTGYTDGTLKASNYITRAESVKVLDNLFGIIYNEPGVYGPSLDQGKLELKGNLTVSVNDVTLQNMIIDGDLYLAEGIGDGDVILDNITVKGETIVKGGGANSIIIRNSSLQNLLIIKKDGNIRIIAQGSTSINNTYLHSSAKLKGEELNNSFGAVEIIRVTPGVAIELEGGFEKIDLLANADIEINGKSELQELYIHKDLENVYIQVSRDSTVKKLYANSEIEVVIRGVIIEALGEFAKASSYDIKLPENLKPKSSSGTSRPAAPKYTLALDIVPAGAGTVIGSGSYEEGTEVNVSANANDGYEFVEWREGKNLLTTSSAFSYTTTSESKTFTAYFESTGEFAGGSGTEADPYKVATAEHLNNVRDHLDSHFIQIDDIDLGVSPWKDGEGWNPIGSGSAPFEGSYDGDDHSIYSLTINRPDEGYLGLFGYLEDASLKNVRIQGHQINGKEYLGALAGYMKEGQLYEIHVDGSVVNENPSGRNIGGLIGYNERGLIRSSSARGNVTGNDYQVAGLVGENRGVIKECFTTGMIVIGDSNSGGLVGRSYPYASYDDDTTTWDGTTGIIEESYTTASVTVNGYGLVGGLVGDNSGGYLSGGIEYNGKVIRSYSNAVVEGYSRVGGLVGGNSGIIEESFATGEVKGYSEVGGFTGYSFGYIYDSYSIGDVEGNDQVGGFIGRNTDDIENCYSVGKVVGETDRTGGFLGYYQSGVVDGCYWDRDQSEMTTSAGGTGYTSEQMTNSNNFSSWDFDTVWDIDEDNSYPYLKWQGSENIPYPPSPFAGGNGTESDPYQIAKAEHLNNIRNYLGSEHNDKHFKLIENINLAEYLGESGDGYNGGAGWLPIGEKTEAKGYEYFTGVFDGNGKTISNLFINRPEMNYTALFRGVGYTTGQGKIMNLNIEDADITGKSYVGVLAGRSTGVIEKITIDGMVEGYSHIGGILGLNETGSIKDSIAMGIVKSNNINGEHTGGIAGKSIFGSIEYCLNESTVVGAGDYTGGLVGSSSTPIIYSNNTGNITGNRDYTGGLVGYNFNSGHIEYSFNSGAVTGKRHCTGGLAGKSEWYIEYSYNTGEITGTGENTGGLVGFNSSKILDSYNCSEVIGESDYTGGIVGFNQGKNSDSYADISRTYNTGVVSGVEDTGGLIGAIGQYSSVSISFWDTETSNQTISAGGTGKTTNEMKQQSTYPTTGRPSWNFDTVWHIDEGISYPYLRNNEQLPHPKPPIDIK